MATDRPRTTTGDDRDDDVPPPASGTSPSLADRLAACGTSFDGSRVRG